MPRSDQQIRQWIALKFLEANGRATLRRLTSELDDTCHERTIRRDLEALSLAGFPIYTEREDGKTYWVLSDTYRRFPIPLTPTDLFALHCSRELLRPLEGTFVGDSLNSLFQKARSMLSRGHRSYLDLLQKGFSIGWMPHKHYEDYQAHIEQIREAIEEWRTIEVRYVPLRSVRASTRRIDPYVLRYQNGSLYLIGYDHLRKDERTFAVDRIRSLQITDDSFQMPLYFSVVDYFKDAFGVFRGSPEEVELVFETQAARWVKERVWHDSQQVTPLKRGKIRMNLRVSVTPELIAWVLGFGSQVRVIRPDSLSKAVRNEAWKLLGKYQGLKTKRVSTARIGAGHRRAVGGAVYRP
jgi:predicted DNA-binding transcriptional regulator YafY